MIDPNLTEASNIINGYHRASYEVFEVSAKNQLKALQLFNQSIGNLLPKFAAKVNLQKFLTPGMSAKRDMTGWNLHANLGTALIWQRGNSDQGLKVLLMHGWQSHAGHWIEMADALVAEGFTVYALDGPAHGDAPGSTSNPIEFAETLVKAQESLGELFAVIGHSMGAGALLIAASDGLKTKCIVSVSGPSQYSHVVGRFVELVKLPRRAAIALQEMIDSGTDRARAEISGEAMISRIKLPTLIVHDEDDHEVPFLEALEIQRYINGAELITTSGFGHRRIIRDLNVAQQVASWVKARSLDLK